MNNSLDLIKKILITERTVGLNESGKYVFMVEPRATKSEIKKAIKELYNVEVASVNTISLPGKTKRYRNTRVKKSGIKKAVVTLKKGQKIDVGR